MSNKLTIVPEKESMCVSAIGLVDIDYDPVLNRVVSAEENSRQVHLWTTDMRSKASESINSFGFFVDHVAVADEGLLISWNLHSVIRLVDRGFQEVSPNYMIVPEPAKIEGIVPVGGKKAFVLASHLTGIQTSFLYIDGQQNTVIFNASESCFVSAACNGLEGEVYLSLYQPGNFAEGPTNCFAKMRTDNGLVPYGFKIYQRDAMVDAMAVDPTTGALVTASIDGLLNCYDSDGNSLMEAPLNTRALPRASRMASRGLVPLLPDESGIRRSNYSLAVVNNPDSELHGTMYLAGTNVPLLKFRVEEK